MKAILIGHEFSEGISKKTNKPYAIGRLYAAVKLDSANGNAKGAMGAQYDTTPEVVRSIAHNSLPLEVELEIEEVMRFGNKESRVVGVKPLQRAAAGTAMKAA